MELLRTYTHWGDKNINRFIPVNVKNHEFLNKPIGCLWASPDDTDLTWLEWVERNDFNNTIGEEKYTKDNSFKFKLKEDTRLLNIASSQDMVSLPKLSDGGLLSDLGCIYLDWEELSKSYDAVLVRITGDNDIYSSFREYDVDSLIVFNLDKIEII